MQRFRLLKQTRQSTEYSCGACALQSVMSYWGKDVDEAQLMKFLGTTPEEGTWPEELVRVAREQGLQAELKAGLTLEEVQQECAHGPVIVLGQVWRSAKGGETPVTDEWDCGHWFIALDVDQDYVYIQDPYVRMGKGFVPRKTFEDAWHNVMGGDRSKPEQRRVGIFIRGNKPAEPQRFTAGDFSGLASGKFGSLNLMTTEFQGSVFPFDFMTDLKDVLTTEGMLRPDAFLFVRWDDQGLTAIQGGRLEEEDEIMEINAVVGILAGLAEGQTLTTEVAQAVRQAAVLGDFGLSVAEVQRVAQRVQPGNSAIIVLFENLWERKFREVAAQHQGRVVRQRLISSDTLIQLGQELRASVGQIN